MIVAPTTAWSLAGAVVVPASAGLVGTPESGFPLAIGCELFPAVAVVPDEPPPADWARSPPLKLRRQMINDITHPLFSTFRFINSPGFLSPNVAKQ
jgi:hypothetical protein